MRTLWWGVLCGVAMLVVTAVVAQEAALPNGVSGGTVSGRLTFAETQLPARFAEVMLVRKPNAEELAELQDFPPRRQQKPAAKEPEKVVSMTGLSGMDGSYTIADVPPGDWFAVAHMRGYVVPLGTPANSREAHDIAKLTANIPVVHVEAGRAAAVDLVLHKGGVIAGRVAFQDGSPVIGVRVTVSEDGRDGVSGPPMYYPLQMLRGNQGFGSLDGNSAVTDDQGRYRIAGLTPGMYVVTTSVAVSGGMRQMRTNQQSFSGRPIAQSEPVTIFQPGTLHRAQAKERKIAGDEVVEDADIEVDLSGLHTVRGRVLGHEDRKPLKQAFVFIAEDGDERLQERSANAGPDGTFAIDYLPPGSYTLTCNAVDFEEMPMPNVDETSGIGMVSGSSKVRARYETVKVPVVIVDGDVVVDDVLLTKVKASEKDDAPE